MINHFKASEGVLIGIAKKMGFFDVRFLTNWQDIVGSEISQKCSPVKMTFDLFSRESILLVSSLDLSFKSMFTHYREVILAKVRFYFGVNFIKDVKIAKF
jgi:hypothetical protein